MLDLTKPVQTRGGRKVRILATDAGRNQPVIGLLAGDKYTESLESWGLDGRYRSDAKEESSMDLVNVPEVHVRYLNLYGGTLHISMHRSRVEADQYARLRDRKGCYRVELVDGQFDE